MKNKKAHIIVLITTTCVTLFLLTLIVFGYLVKKDELSVGSVILDIVLILWFGTFTISFYTCWRIACTDEGKHNGFVSHLIYASRGNSISLIYVIPLLLSPIFIILYIKLFRIDNEKH